MLFCVCRRDDHLCFDASSVWRIFWNFVIFVILNIMSDAGDPEPTAMDPNQALLAVTRLLGQLTTQVSTQAIPEPVVFLQGSGRSLTDFFIEFLVGF